MKFSTEPATILSTGSERPFREEKARDEASAKNQRAKADDSPTTRLLFAQRSREWVETNLVGRFELRVRVERFVEEQIRAILEFHRKVTCSL